MNLAWKILGIVACILLAASAVISHLSRDAVKQEQALAKRGEANLAATRKRAIEADDSLKENTQAIALAETDRDAAEKEVEDTTAEEAEYTAEIAAREVDLAQVKKRVADIKLKIREIGSIEKLLADIKNMEKQVSDTEAEITNRDQKLRIAVEKVEELNKEIDVFSDLERRQRKGQVAEDFKANVSSVFPTWGFVLLNKGNQDGVYANAELEIERNGKKLGRVYVTRVEQNSAIANFVTNTWSTGIIPQAGDLVTRAPIPELTSPTQENGEQIIPSDFNAGGGFENDPRSNPLGDPLAPEEDNAAPSDDPFGGF